MEGKSLGWSSRLQVRLFPSSFGNRLRQIHHLITAKAILPPVSYVKLWWPSSGSSGRDRCWWNTRRVMNNFPFLPVRSCGQGAWRPRRRKSALCTPEGSNQLQVWACWGRALGLGSPAPDTGSWVGLARERWGCRGGCRRGHHMQPNPCPHPSVSRFLSPP